MAVNVFGTPVTEGTRMERALRALNNPNENDKRNLALNYVRLQKANWGNGVSTLCIFYNATGETLIYTQDDSWYGGIHDSYPTRVQNGQWGAFFHVKATAAASGSVGFVVYRVRISDSEFCNQVLCWQTPWGQLRYNNHAYCDIFDDGKVDTADEIYKKMELSGRQTSVMKKGMLTTATIELGTSPLFEAEFTLADVAGKKNVVDADQDVEASTA